ncbi:SIR2 family NAD-dependent protein deacylase [Corallococcus exiguus]|uniref:SIR2 family NAD-dependent protein deacylase n=1 Tax=Corallococcus exiguus TaxID=83462 RepID=UPI0014941470|nr:SIR2 family protein [Corallococcus exiguus]NPD29675.1 SIR2 family protein [Corallococcus exiguus]
MIKWPEQLVEDVARRRAIAFLGAGVSKNSTGKGLRRPPNWSEFLETALKKCPGPTAHIKKLIKDQDYLTACEIIKQRLDEDFNSIISQEFVDPHYTHAQIHRDIFKLDLRLVATQNFDRIYDNFAQSESKGTTHVKSYSDEDISIIARGKTHHIIKVHGSVEQPAKMIFTRKEYTEARYKHGPFYALMDALALTQTFLFLGCSISDPDIRLMLERHTHMHPYARPHYIVMPRNALHEDVRESTRKNLNLKILTYDPKLHHQELADSIAALTSLVETERDAIAAERRW